MSDNNNEILTAFNEITDDEVVSIFTQIQSHNKKNVIYNEKELYIISRYKKIQSNRDKLKAKKIKSNKKSKRWLDVMSVNKKFLCKIEEIERKKISDKWNKWVNEYHEEEINKEEDEENEKLLEDYRDGYKKVSEILGFEITNILYELLR